jgi:hypothetical protein
LLSHTFESAPSPSPDDTDFCLPKIAAEGVDRGPAEVDPGEGLFAILGLPALGKVFLECLAVLVRLRGLHGEAFVESKLGGHS